MPDPQTVGTFRASLDKETRALVDALRALAAAAHPNLVETLKWNAPSFALDGVDRLTLGIERKGGVRVVLHRGAKMKDASSFRFDDPDRLARWPAADRGVIVVRTEGEVAEKAQKLSALFARWLAVADNEGAGRAQGGWSGEA